MNRIKTPAANLVSFKELFALEGDRQRRSFEIPEYQRGYSWQTRQRKDLLDDLERTANTVLFPKHGDYNCRESTQHFCGTIICTPLAAEDIFNIVDGQQRITSLAILHSVISRVVAPSTFQPVPFNPSDMDRLYFQNVVRYAKRDEPKTASQSQYRAAYNEFEEWLRVSGHPARKLLDVIDNHFFFILFVLKDDHEVSRVFETINNRGKPLSQMDLVKNHLIYLQNEHNWHVFQVNTIWADIIREDEETRYVGSETADTVLNAVVATMFHPGRRRAGVTDFSLISENVTDENTFYLLLRFLQSAFQTFRKLRGAFETTGDKVTEQLTYLNFHASITSVLPLIICREFVREDANKNNEAPILEAIERANFRLYGLLNASKRSDSHKIPLHTLAHEYLKSFKKNRTLPDLPSELEKIVRAKHPDGVEQIAYALTLDDNDTTDFYDWSNLRYFLARWEQSNMDKQNFNWRSLRNKLLGTNDELEIEHITPQKPNHDSSDEETPPEYAYNDRQLIRRLGNLMLLPKGVNIVLSNGTLDEKRTKLSEQSKRVSGLQSKRLSIYVEKAIKFQRALENRGNGLQREEFYFDDSAGSQFYTPTTEANRQIALLKTLCDMREMDMIGFSLKTWMFPKEKEYVKTRYCGVISFSHSGVAYKANEESNANKLKQNAVLDSQGEFDKRKRMVEQRESIIQKSGMTK